MRKCFLVVILLVSLFLLTGCNRSADTDNDAKLWVGFSYFQERLENTSAEISLSSWQTIQQDDQGFLYRTVLSCHNNQCQHNLEVFTDSKENITSITLQSRTSDDGCFAEASYHVFCSMGFADKDAKGNSLFPDANSFVNHFQFSFNEDSEKSMWINHHKVSYAYLPISKTCYFAIRYNE